MFRVTDHYYMCLIAQEAGVRNTIREEVGTYQTSSMGLTVCQGLSAFPWVNLISTRTKLLVSSSSHREEMWLRSVASPEVHGQEGMGLGAAETVASEQRREDLLTLLHLMGKKISAP